MCEFIKRPLDTGEWCEFRCANPACQRKPFVASCKVNPKAQCVIDGKAQPAPAEPPPRKCEEDPGVGTNLKRLISKLLGQEASESCNCEKLCKQMNEWGPQGCLDNMKEILDHLTREAKARKLWWFNRKAARLVVKQAIRIERKRLKHVSGGTPKQIE